MLMLIVLTNSFDLDEIINIMIDYYLIGTATEH